ncbi:flavohemoglobin expression-modulating QEGLA motif protein [Leeuwenhoekiella marinoflava]|uniref:flavohemoglobin expression-modulating QEGLA motif protein n=1 Tax=Leeuwenhoekiella marinoflava TaxID=988 RepID=UPI003002BD79
MKSILNETIDLLADLEPGKRTMSDLPYGGFLVLEHDVPALLIYRKKPNDKATLRLARTGASYLIIGDSHFEYFRDFIKKLTAKMAERFGSFILVELYRGEPDSTSFIIKGPTNKLPASLETLSEELSAIDSRRYKVKLDAKISHTKDRQKPGDESLIDLDELKSAGGTLLGLELPPVYGNKSGKVYPLYFRMFRDRFAKAIQKTIYEFIRVQTTSNIHSYHTLGRRRIHEEVLKIDRQITEIQSRYEFLWLVAPVNIQALRKKFFETKFEEIDSYHYRLLPVDPDLLKRELYNLRIDEIDDPSLSHLYNEKREELDKELTMLKERGSKNFFYSSIRLYQGVPRNVLAEAKLILETIPENHEEIIEKTIDAHQFQKMAQAEFDFFKEQAPHYEGTVHIRNDVNIIMVSNGELYLPEDYKMTTDEAQALIQHEIGTHALTHFNGSQQTLSQLSAGFADYDATQEGIAVLSEFLGGGLTGNRLRILAGRVVAGEDLMNGADFKSVFHHLYTDYGFTKQRAFNITSRMFQGGGFLKDIIYLKGLVELRDYLGKGGDLKPLLAGKFALKHVDIINDLTQRELLNPPKIIPRYFKNEDFSTKLNAFKEGITLSKMI